MVLALGACDDLLEVDLPAAVTEDAINNPSVAPILVNSVMALVECAYSSFAIDAAGAEDNFQEVTGVAQDYSQYDENPSGGSCDTDSYSAEWVDSFLAARAQASDTYGKITGWDVADKDELLATTAIYSAIVLENFGTYFCEGAINESPLMNWDQVLDSAEAWLNTAESHLGTDFAIETQQGTIATSAQSLVDGLRARIVWMRDGAAAAAADAAAVPDGFMAYILREEGEKRRNMVASTQGNGGGVQAAGFVQGPIVQKLPSNDYGHSIIGTKPIPGTAVSGGDPWDGGVEGTPMIHTGYIDLAIDSEGRAVDTDGNAFTLTSTTDVVGALTADSRVETAIGNTAGGPDYVEAKYGPDLAADIPLVNWREMRLIEAEAAAPSAAATALVNTIRTADGLPTVSGSYETLVNSDADAALHMIIEERRRALWLEARYWATKLQHTDMLWFPRAVGDLVNAGASYVNGGLVRYHLPLDEYQINPNIRDAGGLDLRGTGCPIEQAPVGPWNAS
jgi:hypothetical protein